jgi:hypothetical protein
VTSSIVCWWGWMVSFNCVAGTAVVGGVE